MIKSYHLLCRAFFSGTLSLTHPPFIYFNKSKLLFHSLKGKKSDKEKTHFL